jgi:hypothetical protein
MKPSNLKIIFSQSVTHLTARASQKGSWAARADGPGTAPMPPDLANAKVSRKKARRAKRERRDSSTIAEKVSPAASRKRPKATPGDSASRMPAMLLQRGSTLTFIVRRFSSMKGGPYLHLEFMYGPVADRLQTGHGRLRLSTFDRISPLVVGHDIYLMCLKQSLNKLESFPDHSAGRRALLGMGLLRRGVDARSHVVDVTEVRSALNKESGKEWSYHY